MNSIHSGIPFDIFVRNYSDDMPICTLTFGINSKSDASPHPDIQDDLSEEQFSDNLSQDMDQNQLQHIQERVNNQFNLTLLDLKQMIHDKCKFYPFIYDTLIAEFAGLTFYTKRFSIYY